MKKFNYTKWVVENKQNNTLEEQVTNSKGERLSGIALANLRNLKNMKNHASVTFKGDASYEDRTFQKQADNEDADKFVFRNEKGVTVSPEDLAQYQFGGAKSGKLMNNPLTENDPLSDEDQEEEDRNKEMDALDDIPSSLREAATQLGYLHEQGMYIDDDEWEKEMGRDPKFGGLPMAPNLNKIEKGVTAITGGGRRHASVSDRGDSIRVSFRYMRGEFDSEEWDKILKYLTGMGFEIKDASNYYEANYDREEPAEAVPTIYLKKNINEEAPENRDQMAGLLLKTLQQNKGEVEKAVNGDIPKEYHNKLTDFAMDDLGDVSAETYDDDPIYPTGGLSFRLAADVDPEFLGQEGDEPRYFDLNGVKIAYIGYNI